MTDPQRLLRRLVSLPPDRRRAALEAVGAARAAEIDSAWRVWVRDGQAPPPGDWHVWLMLTGRGFGKTRAGAEWVSEKARTHPDARIALVGATPDEARRVMIEGPGGLFAAARRGEERSRMVWEPSLRRLTFASGAEAFVYSGADGESLRGPEHHFAWCDELAKWKRADPAWDNLLFGLRAGRHPQVVVTTTPRSVPAVRRVLAMPGIVVTGGASRQNPFNAAAFVPAMERLYAGTRLGRQELEGKLIDDVAGSLWPRDLIEKSRVPPLHLQGRGTARSAVEGPLHHASHGPPPRENLGEDFFKRIVIGVDPPATADGDECGIIVCGLGEDGLGYVLADMSEGGLSPDGWARRVAYAAETWEADRVVAEGNQGGEMVEILLRGAGLHLPVRRVHAKFGKTRRAEPVAALFERGEARFAGTFPKLEDQLAGMTIGGDYEGPGRSADRADAMVWALTELMLQKERAEPRIRVL